MVVKDKAAVDARGYVISTSEWTLGKDLIRRIDYIYKRGLLRCRPTTKAMREASESGTATSTDSYAFYIHNFLSQRGDDFGNVIEAMEEQIEKTETPPIYHIKLLRAAIIIVGAEIGDFVGIMIMNEVPEGSRFWKQYIMIIIATIYFWGINYKISEEISKIFSKDESSRYSTKMLDINIFGQFLMGLISVVGCFHFYIGQYAILETLEIFGSLIAFAFYTIGQTYVGYLMFQEDEPLLGFTIITLALASPFILFAMIFGSMYPEDERLFYWCIADGIGTFITYILYNQFFKRKANEISIS